MNKGIYKTTHFFYAYIAACAIGLLVNGLIIFLIHLLVPFPSNEQIISTYTGKDGYGFFIATLILGAFFYRYTKKLNIVKSK
ncbi:MAG: hypothetical protein OEY06_12200 [Gammaproteobacteria bacterium]|nr:hypothetical protein [Gammaproteobacteria bacterium]